MLFMCIIWRRLDRGKQQADGSDRTEKDWATRRSAINADLGLIQRRAFALEERREAAEKQHSKSEFKFKREAPKIAFER